MNSYTMNSFCLACGAFVAATLHGCASETGGNATTTAAVTNTAATATATTTTLTTTGIPPSPRDGNVVVNLMNTEYFGYSEGNTSSYFGNTIRIAHDANIWCGSGCHLGEPDCRVSASILNSKMMIDPYNNWRAGGWFNYQNGQGMTGLYFNSTLVTKKLAKCTYAWDGATTGKLNGGCGCARPTGADFCNVTKHPEAPYFDKCGGTPGHTCTQNDHDVESCLCKNWSQDKPANGVGNMCFWKGVAFDTTSSEDSEDETHEMLDWRMSHTADGSGSTYGPAILTWNEIVLDGQRVLDAMKTDPAGTIVAVVYNKDQNKQAAKGIASDMQKAYRLSKPVPVIMLNESANVKEGSSPWVYREEDQVTSTFVV